MIEIKSVNNEVLYTAQSAQDVRQALIEAAAKNADLGYANLGYADLGYADLRNANLGYADLRNADLGYANLGYANLGYANLGYANLRNADLRNANLRNASLGYANLGYANLRNADLRNAKGINPLHYNPLLLLLDQPGVIRAYKLTTSHGEGPYNGGIFYEVGKSYEVPNADTNSQVQCGVGINVATLPWCIQEYREGYRIFVVEFKAQDIAAIPLSDGKFRLHRCKVVAEKTLVELGLA